MTISTESILRILKNGYILGTGFLVSKDLVVTCAHVIAIKDEPIQVQFADSTEILPAQVVYEYWREPGNGDIAFLRLEKIPENRIPLRLGDAEHSPSGRQIQAFGYPNMGVIEGIHARGEILGIVAENSQRLIQLRSEELDQGHSGAPVWDEKRSVVVGMVVSVYKSDASGKLRDTAFAIPSETLRQVCLEIQSSEIQPYIGLQNFTNESAQFFFGREALTEKLLDVLRRGCRFMAVFGPSGSGKSSVLRAGLLPALKKGRLPSSQKWAQITIRPADNPLEQLKVAGLDSFDIKKYLEAHVGMERVVLLVDQFEEIFTLCPEDLRNKFVHDLAAALENSRLILILSMRDDFYSAFNAKAAPLAESDHLKIENVPGTLKRDELVAIIKRPAESLGLALEEGLPELILKDLITSGSEARSSTLPLLEFALTQLWEKRHDGLLTHEAYQTIGGVTGSLARWADDAYSDLPKSEQPLAESILTSLVHLGDEAQGLPDTRKRRKLSDLAKSESAYRVIRHFADRRLVVTSGEIIELIHDAVLLEWGQFSVWLNENRNFLTWQQKTGERWKEWNDGKGELLRGRELAMAQAFWAKRRIDLSEIVDLEKLGNYISLSAKQVLQMRLLIAGSITLAFILLGSFGISAWNQRNNAINSQSTTIAGMATQTIALGNEQNALLTAMAESTRVAEAQAIATAFEGLAGANEKKANDETTRKLSEKLSAQALSIIETNYSQGLLLGVESFKILKENGLSKDKYPDTLPVLLEKIPVGLMNMRMFPPSGLVRKILYSPNGNLMVAISDTIDIWSTEDSLSPSLITSWNNRQNIKASDVTFNPDGTVMAIGYQDGHVELWDTTSSDIKKMMEFDAYQPDLSPDVKVAISTDGTILATAGNGTILLFDISNPGSSREMGHVSHPHEGESVEYLWFDPNYQSPFLISGGGDGSFHVWNLRESNFTPVSPYRSIPRNHGIADIAISSKYVIVAGEDTLYISSNFNNAFTPISAVTYSDFHHGLVQTMMINSSNTRLFTAGQDGVIVEWDIADPHRIKFIKNYSGHTNRVSSTAFHPSGKFIVSGGDDSKIVIWGITQEVIPSILRSKIKTDSAITDIAYSPKLGLLAVGEEEGGITLWNISDPDAPVIDYQIPIRTPIAHVAFSPDETVFMYLSNATNAYRPTGYMRDLVRFDYSETRRLFELNTPDIFVGKNHYILAGEIGDGTLKIFQWNVDGKVNREHDPISTGACPFRNAAFTMDGAFAAIATCKVQLWNFPDVGSPSMIQEIGSPNPRGVDLSLDGSLLASANADNSISLWSIPQDRAPKLLSTKGSEHLNPVTSVTINSEKNMMASGGDDPSIIYWDITSPANPSQRFILTGHSSTILNGGTFFSADGKILISASKDEVVLWDIDSDSWMKKACSIAGRNFTQLEWNQFVGKDTPYHPTCLELPIPED